MRKTNLAVNALRALLVLAFGLLVLLQTISLPGQFAAMADENPEDAYLRWPLTIFAVVEVLCVQVVIVCTWRLLSMVRRGHIFSPASLKWVDAIIAAMATAWVLLTALFVYVGFRADDPGLPILVFLVVVGGAVLGLLMVVMRTLLRQATTLQSDMDEVL